AGVVARSGEPCPASSASWRAVRSTITCRRSRSRCRARRTTSRSCRRCGTVSNREPSRPSLPEHFLSAKCRPRSNVCRKAALREDSSSRLEQGSTMKALVRDRYGPPDVLEVREVEQPVPKVHEVLVRVHAASINDWDWALLQAPPPPLRWIAPMRAILGCDVAGRVVSSGSHVQRWQPGDEVFGDLSRFSSGGFGGFAEYVCAPELALARKPA